MGGNKGEKSPAALRRRMIKSMKRRALKFQEEATTPEEFMAWGKVVKWCADMLSFSVIRKEGDLGLWSICEERMEQILDGDLEAARAKPWKPSITFDGGLRK